MGMIKKTRKTDIRPLLLVAITTLFFFMLIPSQGFTPLPENCYDADEASYINNTEGITPGREKRENENSSSSASAYSRCLVVPQRHSLVMVAELVSPPEPCDSRVHVMFDTFQYTTRYKLSCLGIDWTYGSWGWYQSLVFFMQSQLLNVSLHYSYGEVYPTLPERIGKNLRTYVPKDARTVNITFVVKPISEQLWTTLTPIFTAVSHGFLSPEFRTHSYYYCDSWYNLTVPHLHVLMVSFPLCDLPDPDPSNTFLDSSVTLSSLNAAGSVLEHYTYGDTDYITPTVFHHTAMLVIHFASARLAKKLYDQANVNMSFSFHPESAAPSKLNTGLFNCSSVPHYASFKQHLHCNLERECEGGEDEGGHCPFSSPACHGGLDARGKCYFPVDFDSPVTWQRARAECQNRSGDLATMKTDEEWEAFWKLSDYRINWNCSYVGLLLRTAPVLSFYRNTWTWLDGTRSFDTNVTTGEREENQYQDLFAILKNRLLEWVYSNEERCPYAVCQIDYNSSKVHGDDDQIPTLRANVSAQTSQEMGLVHCPAGHLTHYFLRCDTASHCGAERNLLYCIVNSAGENAWPLEPGSGQSVGVAMFQCDNKRTTIPYTFVCDFRRDCSDNSDEVFCRHTDCGTSSHMCGNGQCIAVTSVCDRATDCLDGSDERDCIYLPRAANDFIFLNKNPAPAIITYTGAGTYEQTPMNTSESCPDFFFRCPSSRFCLPVYLRCNGVSDCLQHEDERDCENYTCPGFYRCREASGCVHVQQLCDGIAQCPRGDDEMLCDISCPDQCHCQGLEFVCPQPFAAGNFSQLRYLDARYSLMTLEDFTRNMYLVYLDLRSCGLNSITTAATLPNLRHLDLALNSLHAVDMDVFLLLRQLKDLRLGGNPLTSLSGGDSGLKQLQLKMLDLSDTALTSFTSEPLTRFFSIQTINISMCSAMKAIGREGFQSTQSLQQLDLRGNPIKVYPQNVFETLVNIQLVFTDNYKLCCPGMFPEGYEEDLCQSPQNEISSCQDLLRSDLYRAPLWIMSVASIVGNVGCFFFRNVVMRSKSASAFNTFISSLSVADSLMGIYLAFLGVADQVYRGTYYLHEDTWLYSIPCTVAGVLSLLSSEVSALTICFVTLDRCIVLRFPFSTLRFTRRSAVMACVVTWSVGLALSLTPLFNPVWEFYSQTGICVPLPVTRKAFPGQVYSFGVIIVFNFVLFLLIAAGQVFVYHSVRVNSMAAGTSQKMQDITIARRLLTVAVSDFLCWFPIGMLGLLAFWGVPIPGEVSVAMAIFILPLNSALNPFLYTFNMMLERRRKEKERRLLTYLETENEGSSVSANTRNSEYSDWGLINKRVMPRKAEEIMRCVQSAIDQHFISSDQVRDVLLSYQDNVQ